MIYETTWRIVIQSIGSLLLLMILIVLVIEIYDRLNRYIKRVLKHKKEKRGNQMEGWKELKQYVGDFMCKVDTKIGQMEKTEKEAYERGLKIGEKIGMEKAWDTARKIVNMIGVKREDIFGYMTYLSIMNKFSATEAIEKIRQHEQEQEELKVGDEVMFYNGEKCIVTVVGDGQAAEVMDKGGFSMRMDDGLRNSMKKTGRYFPEIAEVLKKMQEETA